MIELVIEKVLVRGTPKIKIVSVDGVHNWDKLPEKYTQDDPCLVRNETNVKLFFTYSDVVTLWEKDKESIIVSVERWKKIKEGIIDAGKRLHDINNEIKELEKTWKGIETHYI